jgi:hypothetical protein
LATATLLLAGCGGAGAPAETSPTSSASATSVIPTPAASAKPSATPDLVFDGDCSAVIDEATLTSITGTAVVAHAVAETTPSYAAIPTLGGINCLWVDPTDLMFNWSVIVLPLETGELPEAARTDCNLPTCIFTATGPGFQAFGVFQDPDGNAETMTAHGARAAEHISSLDPGATEPYVPVDPWPSDLDCTTVDVNRAVAAALGSADTAAGGSGGDFEPNAGFATAYHRVRVVTCYWEIGNSSFSAEISPGAGWRRTAVSAEPGVTEVSIEGVDAAYIRDSRIEVFSGSNWFTFRGYADGASIDIGALLAGAGALASNLDGMIQ